MLRLRPVAALLPILLVACLDPHRAEVKRIQQQNLAYETPAALHAEASHAAARPFNMRVYATPEYVAQTLDWQRHVRAIVDDANAVLAPELKVRIEITEMRVWQPTANRASLTALLAALEEWDEGDGADWVLGLVGGLPKLSQSFHEVGMAETPGKHLVVRAEASLEEHDAIERAFGEVSEAERTKLQRERRRHRATCVLLHELAHTLGAPHDGNRTSLMHPEYDPRMNRFSDEALGAMAETAAHRGDGGATPLPAAKESAPAIPKGTETLPPDDRARFLRAVALAASGDLEKAWALAEPLFDAYPDHFLIQDFRCRMALSRGGAWQEVRRECAPIERIGTSR